MLERIRNWWARKRKEREHAALFERAVVVAFDEVGIAAAYPKGDVQKISWAEVEQVSVETNDSGPWGADVWWVLSGSGRKCTYPGGATGEQEALAEFPKRFSSFRHEEVIRAMGSTSNAQFICWQRGHAL